MSSSTHLTENLKIKLIDAQNAGKSYKKDIEVCLDAGQKGKAKPYMTLIQS